MGEELARGGQGVKGNVSSLSQNFLTKFQDEEPYLKISWITRKSLVGANNYGEDEYVVQAMGRKKKTVTWEWKKKGPGLEEEL